VRLTPEEIEARRFRLSANGYDCEAVDRFLADIAEALRSPGGPGGDADEFGRVGLEIATILRNARDSAGAIKAEAEGHAAALRSRAEAEAGDVRKAAASEAEALHVQARAEIEAGLESAERELADARRTAEEAAAEADAVRATAETDAKARKAAAEDEAEEVRRSLDTELEASRQSVQVELDAQRTTAQTEADQIRVEADRRLTEAAAVLAKAKDDASARLDTADREVATRLEEASLEAEQKARELVGHADEHAAAAAHSENETYLRLLAARDELQVAIDRLRVRVIDQAGVVIDDDPGSVVDLTKAPAQVRPAHAEEADATDESGRADRTEPVESVTASASSADADSDSDDEPGVAAIPPTELDFGGPGAGGPGDPLLRMVRAAVGRASKRSGGEGVDREASAS
jgi:DivIVA domain-containing protein